MNVDQATDEVGRLFLGGGVRQAQRLRLAGVRELLAESRIGLDRIRDIVKNLSRGCRGPRSSGVSCSR